MRKGTDDLVKDALLTGFLDTRWQREEMTQFLGMVQRFVELLQLRTSIERTSQDVVRIIIEEADFDNCSILLWNQDQNCLSLVAAFGSDNLLGSGGPRTYNNKLRFNTGEGIAGRAFSEGKASFIEDVREETNFLQSDGVVRPLSLACLPLLHLGVLNLSAYHPHRFSPDLKRNWQLLSKIVGYLLLYASLHERMDSTRQSPCPDPGCSSQTDPDQTLDAAAAQDFSAQLIDHAPQGICVLDAEGNIRQMNKSFEVMLGKGPTELTGRSPAVFFQDPRVLVTLFEKAAASNRAEMADVALLNSDGAFCPTDVYLVKLTDCDRTTGYLLVVIDISKKKAFAEQILRTEKLVALKTMARGVAHDFNNLLMTILGNTQMISFLSNDEQLTQRLQNIEKAVHEGAQTVRRLQQFHDRDGASRSSTVSVDVAQTLAEIAEGTGLQWQKALEKDGHSGHFQMELEPGCVAAIHPSDLHEVATNLILNAVEALPKGGTVTLRCSSSNGWIVAEVADTGRGMSQDTARRAFDPFYTTKDVGHSGLGLYVSMSLVHRSGGEIKVHSKLGKGCTFTVTLPRAEVAEVQSHSAVPDQEPRAHHLLVVDDDVDVLSILRDMLRFKGHKVVAMQNAEEALQLIDKESFDLVLTDLGMPVVSGWDIAKRVKSKDPRIPVILLTGWGAHYEEQDLAVHGIDMVVSKPLSWENLLEVVRELLEAGNDIRSGSLTA